MKNRQSGFLWMRYSPRMMKTRKIESLSKIIPSWKMEKMEIVPEYQLEKGKEDFGIAGLDFVWNLKNW